MAQFESGRSDWSVDIMNDNGLNAVVEEGNIDKLYTLIQNDPHILDHFDKIPFVQTPLHVAASTKHLKFAAEIMRLKPLFAFKPNPQGLCPIHLALQAGQNGMAHEQNETVDYDQRYRMAHRFVDINKDLVRVKGKEGFTPLHWASQFEEIDLIRKFLKVCPNSIEDVTVRGETALHIAVKHKKVEALKFLIDWLHKNINKGAAAVEKKVLNWKDDDGNTILHITTLKDNTEMVQLLIKSKADLNVKNVRKETPLDLANSQGGIKKILERVGAKHSSSVKDPQINSKIFERWIIHKTRTRRDIPEDRRNAFLVVATLVATATYQTALSPPGGLYQANAETNNSSTLNHLALALGSPAAKAGNSVMSSFLFVLFSSANMFSFVVSTFVSFGLLPRGMVRGLLFVPTFLLQLSYILSVMVISPSLQTATFLGFCFMVLELVFLNYVFLIDFPEAEQNGYNYSSLHE